MSINRNIPIALSVLITSAIACGFVEPYLVTLTDEAEPSPNFQHTGMEFLYLLNGEMTYRYGDRTYELHPGDAIVFDATALHGPEVLKKRPIVYLSVVLNLRA